MFTRFLFLLLIFGSQWTQSVLANLESSSCKSNDGLNFHLRGGHIKLLQDNCKCDDSKCQYCLVVYLPEIEINDNLCLEFELLPENRGLNAFVNYDGERKLGPIVISGVDPPTLMCIMIPISIPIEICINVWDIFLNPKANMIHLCVDIRLYIVALHVDLHLNCVWIKKDSIEFIEKNTIWDNLKIS